MSTDAPPGRSALRALEVFEAFRAARRPLPLSELAQLTGIPVSTCHGVMRALEQHQQEAHHSGTRHEIDHQRPEEIELLLHA